MTSEEFRDRVCLLIGDLSDGKQYKFAELLGEHKSTINRWLSKKHGMFPKEKTLKKIAALNVNIHWLLTGAGEKYIRKEPHEEGYSIQPRELSSTEAMEIIAKINKLNPKGQAAVNKSIDKALNLK